MKNRCLSVFTILLSLIIFGNSALACTTFCLKNKGELIFGKNYDWNIGDGLIFVNKRGVQKKGTDDRNPAKWTARYGSVTFNQYGRENPSGGMNEAGLVIELMWLDDTQYPKAGNKPIVDVLEWIQFNLDTAATVDEVLKNSADVVILSEVKLHYLVSDLEGNTASIEYLEGKLVPHTGDRMPVPVLTNDTYERSLEYSKTADPSKAMGVGSLERFARAADKTKLFDRQPRAGDEAIAFAFDVLGNVAQPGATQWSIVYDQKRRRVHFRTLKDPSIKTIDAGSLDYSCASRVNMLDVEIKATGDVTSLFQDYTRRANRDLIERAFKGTRFLGNVPATVRDSLASYPESFTCTGKDAKKAAAYTGAAAWNIFTTLTFPPYYFF